MHPILSLSHVMCAWDLNCTLIRHEFLNIFIIILSDFVKSSRYKCCALHYSGYLSPQIVLFLAEEVGICVDWSVQVTSEKYFNLSCCNYVLRQ